MLCPKMMVVMFALLLGSAGMAHAKPTPLKATNLWKGSVDDEKLTKEMPENGVITNAKAFEKLFKAWKVADNVPLVNFSKELVLVATSSGSSLNLNASLDENGDLKALSFGTRDFRPGFRYVMISVPKEGVMTVNGKKLKDKATVQPVPKTTTP